MVLLRILLRNCIENLSKYGEFSNATLKMENQSASFTFTDKSPSISTIPNPSLSAQGTYTTSSQTLTTTVEWGRKVYEETQNFSFNYKPKTKFSETLIPSCSVDDSIDFTFSLVTSEGEESPDWIRLDNQGSSITGTIPNVKFGETYTFYLISNWTEIPFTYTNQTVTIEVERAILSSTTAGAIALMSTQGQVAASGVVSVATSVLNGTPPTSLWAIMNQLQVIILTLLIDDYTPEDINQYIEGVGFVMFNFNFLPLEDAPGISIPTNWMDFGEPFDKAEKLGFDSLSTFVNNLSLFLAFIGLSILHMSLKLLVC